MYKILFFLANLISKLLVVEDLKSFRTTVSSSSETNDKNKPRHATKSHEKNYQHKNPTLANCNGSDPCKTCFFFWKNMFKKAVK